VKASIRDVDVAGKRVLVREDLNVPLKNGLVEDDTRIQAAAPTLKELAERGAEVVVTSHLGRPQARPDPEFSLEPVARRLAEALGMPVTFARDCVGAVAQEAVRGLRPGQVALLENVRFHPEEEKNDPNFSRQLAKLGDVYVNDAFGTAHREHASTFGAAQAMQGKPRTIGFLVQKELKFLGDAISNPRRPFLAILGGAKVSDKIKVIEQLLTRADTVLIGGAMAYTFFLAQGKQVGNSLVERDKVDLARQLLAKAGGKIKLPADTVIAAGPNDTTQVKVVEGDIPAGMEGFDIGPKTRENYKAEIARGRTIVWNGPMGMFEKKPFAEGTGVIAQAVADATGLPLEQG